MTDPQSDRAADKAWAARNLNTEEADAYKGTDSLDHLLLSSSQLFFFFCVDAEFKQCVFLIQSYHTVGHVCFLDHMLDNVLLDSGSISY